MSQLLRAPFKEEFVDVLGVVVFVSSSLDLYSSSWKSLSFGANGIYLESHLSKNGREELTCANLLTQDGIPCPQRT